MFNYLTTFITDYVYPFFRKVFTELSFKDWIIIILLILTCIFFWKYRHAQEQCNWVTDAYTQSMSEYTTKSGQLYMQNRLHVMQIDELKKANSELYAEVQDLKDHPVIITKTVTKFQIDTLYMESGDIIHEPKDSTYCLYWNHDEPGVFNIDGSTSVKKDFSDFQTTINHLSVEQELSLDVIDDGDNLSVIARSDNPYVTITGQQSVFIDPKTSPTIKKYFKPKRWGLGVQAGYGVDKNLHGTWYLGVGVSYNFLQF